MEKKTSNVIKNNGISLGNSSEMLALATQAHREIRKATEHEAEARILTSDEKRKDSYVKAAMHWVAVVRLTGSEKHLENAIKAYNSAGIIETSKATGSFDSVSEYLLRAATLTKIKRDRDFSKIPPLY